MISVPMITGIPDRTQVSAIASRTAESSSITVRPPRGRAVTVMFVVSCALYISGLRAAWSVFANFATLIGVGAMFSIEYIVRHRVLPHWERVGIMSGVRAFSRHFSQARP